MVRREIVNIMDEQDVMLISVFKGVAGHYIVKCFVDDCHLHEEFKRIRDKAYSTEDFIVHMAVYYKDNGEFYVATADGVKEVDSLIQLMLEW